MDYRQMSDTLKKVARSYQEDMEFVSKYIKANDLTAKLKLDARDFAPLLALIGIEGDTREARQKDMLDKLKTISDAFSSPNREERKPYLNMIYDLLDNVDPDKVDMENEEQVRQLVQCTMLGQTFGRKKDENPDYINERYPTEQARALADAKDAYLMKATSYVRTNLSKTPGGVINGRPASHEIPTGITIGSAINYISPEVFSASVAYAKLRRDKMQEAYDKNLPVSSKVYNVPVLDSMTESFGTDFKEAVSYDADKQFSLAVYFGSVIQENLLQTEFKHMQGIREADLVQDTDSVYVDGVPFREFKGKNIPDAKFEHCGDEDLSIICKLLLDPKHRLDVVHAYRNENNEMQYEAKALRAAISPEQEKRHLEQNHSWLRRLFNWWPFRIETLQQQLDRASAKGMDKRHESICENIKGRVEAVFERKAEAARQSEINDKETQKKLEAIENENQHLRTAVESSVAKYGEKSAIGVLGQQIKNSNNELIEGATTGIQSARYEKMSLTLAKQVLFAQLCTERVSANGEIGPLEQSLTGDTEEATKEKIEAFAKNVAKDPVLKDVFHAMTGAAKGDYTKLGSDGTRQMILGGGYKALATAYTEQKAIENAQKNLPEVNQNVQLQQQGIENTVAEAQASVSGMQPM